MFRTVNKKDIKSASTDTLRVVSKTIKLLVIGHFGGNECYADGQTIKTKILYDKLAEDKDIKIDKIDTHLKNIHPFILLFISIYKMLVNNNIIVLLSRRGMNFYFPICFFMAKIFKKKIYHILIGSTLDEILMKNPKLAKYLKSFQVNWVETTKILNQLKDRKINNVIILPNFKDIKIVAEDKLVLSHQKPLRICTFSRVMQKKGIGVAVDLIEEINREQGLSFELDIYGQIDSTEIDWFNSLKANFSNSVKYKGVASYAESSEILSSYFLLLFPTEFYTEGIPGTIIDAYAAGLPVVASRWENFNDVITEGKTGYGYDFGERDCLKQVLLNITHDPSIIERLRKNCIIEANRYVANDNIKNVLSFIRECNNKPS